MNVREERETLKAQQRATVEATTRLQVGDLIELGQGETAEPALVWMVNDCRAVCLPLASEEVEFQPQFSETSVRFTPSAKPVSISPNSEVKILKRLGKQGMLSFLEQQKQQKQERQQMKEKQKKAKEEASDKPRTGKLGGFLGHSITSVIRCMAKLGWEFWECRMVFDKEEIPVSDNTIRIQLSAGRNGEGGDPAPVEKELKKIRPSKDEKPERASSKKAKSKKDKKAAEAPAKKSKKQDDDEDSEDEDDSGDDEGEEEEAPAPKKAKSKSKPAPEPEEEEEEEEEEKGKDDDEGGEDDGDGGE